MRRTVMMEVDIFDAGLLLATARRHAPEADISDEAGALIALLDPGGGGDAYAGNLNEAGIQIEQTTVS
jgi:hypothetical protein